MVQNDILLKHLSSIYDPELAVNIVDLGMVKDIKHIEKDVIIKLALTIADCPMRNQIETEIERKLLLLENVDSVKITTTAMSQEDRTAVMEKARKKARTQNLQNSTFRPRSTCTTVRFGSQNPWSKTWQKIYVVKDLCENPR